MKASRLPPREERLFRLLRTRPGPVLQVWGWPGSGTGVLLEALTLAEQGRVRRFARRDLASRANRRKILEEARQEGARWFIGSAPSEATLEDMVALLRPGERLVVATRKRLPLDPLLGSIVSPQDLLLTAAEAAWLWADQTGERPDPDLVQRLVETTEGWHRLVILAAEGAQQGRLQEVSPQALLRLPAVEGFLRHQVLPLLSPQDREVLLEIARSDELATELWREAKSGEDRRRESLRRLLEDFGWALQGRDGSWRLPRPLRAFLTEEGRPSPAAREASRGRRPEGSPAGPHFRVILLGKPAVLRQGAGGRYEARRWTLRRSLKILAYLVSSPGFRASKEELMGKLWPEGNPQSVERNFHPTLSYLRRTLAAGNLAPKEPPLLFEDGFYFLNPDLEWEIDLVEFRARIRQGHEEVKQGRSAAAVAAWEAAWSLYKGPFLAEEEDSWIRDRREEYQRLYLHLLRDLGDLYVELGETERALDAYRAVLTEDPLEERIHVALMRLYSRQGRRDLVRRQYDRLCGLLLEELGVEPLPETTAEFHRAMG